MDSRGLFVNRVLVAVPLLALCVGGGCASFATVRSAEVTRGASIVTQASLAGRPGDEAAWFFNLDCASNCDRSIASGDIAVAYGVRTGSDVPFTIGAGLNGTFPYLEGYAQLGRGKIPFGIGARAGIPIGWAMHELYGRLDIPLSQSARLLWNPGVVYLAGNSPNGENPGSFSAIAQGVGIQFGSGNFTFTPSAAFVWARAEHNSYGEQFGPSSRGFATVAVSVGLRDAALRLPGRRLPTPP
jgi:hypothetical protein